MRRHEEGGHLILSWRIYKISGSASRRPFRQIQRIRLKGWIIGGRRYNCTACLFDLIYVICHVLLEVHLAKDLVLDVVLIVLQEARVEGTLLLTRGGRQEDGREFRGFHRTFQFVLAF